MNLFVSGLPQVGGDSFNGPNKLEHYHAIFCVTSVLSLGVNDIHPLFANFPLQGNFPYNYLLIFTYQFPKECLVPWNLNFIICAIHLDEVHDQCPNLGSNI